MSSHLILVCALLAIGSVTATLPYIAAVVSVDSGVASAAASNVVQFNYTNASMVYAQGAFPRPQSVVSSGALDAVGHRYFVLTDQDLILVYNVVTLEAIGSLTLPFFEFLPSTLQYDAQTDSLWLVYQMQQDHGGSALHVCSMSASKQTDLQCLASDAVPGARPTADASAFDVASRTLWSVATTEAGTSLLGFNVDAHTFTAVAMNASCAQLQLATVKGVAVPVCYSSDASALVTVNAKTGAQTPLAVFLFASGPTPTTTAVCASADKSTSTYVFLMAGDLVNTWYAVDVASGKTIASELVPTSVNMASCVCVQQ